MKRGSLHPTLHRHRISNAIGYAERYSRSDDVVTSRLRQIEREVYAIGCDEKVAIAWWHRGGSEK
jgi:hypothetical protein